jgi:hypothetical protein
LVENARQQLERIQIACPAGAVTILVSRANTDAETNAEN